MVEVLDSLEPQVASLHLSAFDGGKLSLATLLISPKAWAESLAFFAAPWNEDMIEDEPEVLAESLFAHIHGVIFCQRRRGTARSADPRSVIDRLGDDGFCRAVLDRRRGDHRDRQ